MKEFVFRLKGVQICSVSNTLYVHARDKQTAVAKMNKAILGEKGADADLVQGLAPDNWETHHDTLKIEGIEYNYVIEYGKEAVPDDPPRQPVPVIEEP